MKNIVLSSLALLFALFAVPASAQQDSGCLDRREIAGYVASGALLPLDSVLESAGIDSSQEVLSVQVCNRDGWVYIVAVLGPDGYAANLVLPAT